MRSRAELAWKLLDDSRRMLRANLRNLKLEEALAAAGGYRSVLGILKHTASFSHVYHSYAFDQTPRHLDSIAWPRGLRDTVDTTQDYVDEVVSWFDASAEDWRASLLALPDEAFDQPRRLHMGFEVPLFDLVALVAQHWTYHTGELNEILAILRGEAWQYSQEVEENHISTAGHRIRPNWMSEEQAARHEAHLALRDAQLHRSA
jgi:uncharacterized damage-inducible protein DinB